MYTHRDTYMHTCTYTHMCTHMHGHTQIHAHIYKTCIHIYTQMCMLAHIHTHACMHAYIHMCAHIHPRSVSLNEKIPETYILTHILNKRIKAKYKAVL